MLTIKSSSILITIKICIKNLKGVRSKLGISIFKDIVAVLVLPAYSFTSKNSASKSARSSVVVSAASAILKSLEILSFLWGPSLFN